MRSATAALAAVLTLAACGSDPELPAPVSGWIDVPGMECADGTPTGIAISRGSADAVLVYLLGGGACWSETACDADLRSFGKADYDFYSQFVTGTILDRTLPGNPFAAWTIVFVPYCTGDVHAGDSVRTYGTAPAVTWNHHGYRNLEAAVARMASAVAPPEKVVVAGSSAGGFGSLLAYGLVRTEWPASAGVEGALVDDSGPTLVGTAIPDAIRGAWWDAWNLGSTIDPLCAGCRSDLSEIWPALRAAHGADRLALVSTTRDLTMRGFFGGLPAAEFEAALAALTQQIDGGGTAVFQVGGADSTQHALLFAPFSDLLSRASTLNGTHLLPWLSAMAEGSTWTSIGP
jgi:hypothetical protein